MRAIQRIFENIGSRADSIVADLVDPRRTIVASSLISRYTFQIQLYDNGLAGFSGRHRHGR